MMVYPNLPDGSPDKEKPLSERTLKVRVVPEFFSIKLKK
jgi:hypothetical protein